ncbi:flippase [Vibrio cyclitrophicus]
MKILLKNAFWVCIEKGSRLILGLFISGLLARHLGVKDFGNLNFYLTVVIILSVATSLGFNRIIVRETALATNNKLKQINLVYNLVLTRVFISSILFLICLFFSYLQNGKIDTIIIVIISSIFLSFDVIDFYYQGNGDFKTISVIRNISFILTSCIKIILIYCEVSLIYFIYLIPLEHMLNAIMFIFVFYKKSKLVAKLSFNFNLVVKTINESWTEIIAGFGAILFMKLDSIMLKILSTTHELGIYTAATKLSEAWYFFPMMIVSITFPKILEIRKNSKSEYLISIQLLLIGLFYICLLAIFSFFILGPFIISVIYGIEFRESYLILQVHSLSSVFMCFGVASGSYLVAEKKLKINLYRNVIGLIANVILNCVFIHLYGAIGAAIATLISMSIAFYFYDIFNKDTRFIFYMKTNAFRLDWLLKYKQKNIVKSRDV